MKKITKKRRGRFWDSLGWLEEPFDVSAKEKTKIPVSTLSHKDCSHDTMSGNSCVFIRFDVWQIPRGCDSLESSKT